MADAMQDDPEMRDVIGWSLVTPLLQHLRAILRRPLLSREELGSLPGNVREYLEFERSETAMWLSRIPRIPDLSCRSPTDAVIEIVVRARILSMTAEDRRDYLEELRHSGLVPIEIDREGADAAAAVVSALGIAPGAVMEVVRLAGPTSHQQPSEAHDYRGAGEGDRAPVTGPAPRA